MAPLPLDQRRRWLSCSPVALPPPRLSRGWPGSGLCEPCVPAAPVLFPPPGATSCFPACPQAWVAEMGRRPTDSAFCLVSKAQLSQALEELGGQKQRADMVSPQAAPFGVSVHTGKPGGGRLGSWAHMEGLVPIMMYPVSPWQPWSLLVVRNTVGAERTQTLEAESWLSETDLLP